MRTSPYEPLPSTSRQSFSDPGIYSLTLVSIRVLQIQQIKEQVEEKEGIPPVQQRLIYLGKQM